MVRIHPSAIVDSRAELGAGVEVGPYAVIDGPVRLASGCRVGAHAVLQGKVEAGANCVFGPHCIVGTDPQDRGFDPRVDSGVRLGAGNVIRELVTIHRGGRDGGWTTLGDDNFLMAAAHLGHDVVLGSHNNLANAVLLAGHVAVGDRCFFGGGSVVHQFVRIGDLAMLQGNAGVSQDLAPFSVTHRINELAGLNVVGLRRSGLDAAARDELKEVWKRLLAGSERLEAAIDSLRQRALGPAARQLLEFCAAPSRKGLMRT